MLTTKEAMCESASIGMEDCTYFVIAQTLRSSHMTTSSLDSIVINERIESNHGT